MRLWLTASDKFNKNFYLSSVHFWMFAFSFDSSLLIYEGETFDCLFIGLNWIGSETKEISNVGFWNFWANWCFIITKTHFWPLVHEFFSTGHLKNSISYRLQIWDVGQQLGELTHEAFGANPSERSAVPSFISCKHILRRMILVDMVSVSDTLILWNFITKL